MSDLGDNNFWLDAVERTLMDLRCKVGEVPIHSERIEIRHLREQVRALKQAIAAG
jgi:hypothetical protein